VSYDPSEIALIFEYLMFGAQETLVLLSMLKTGMPSGIVDVKKVSKQHLFKIDSIK